MAKLTNRRKLVWTNKQCQPDRYFESFLCDSCLELTYFSFFEQYLDQAVVPVVLQSMSAVAKERLIHVCY